MRSRPGTPLQPMSSRTSSERISQPWLTLARGAWVVCTILLLANFVASVPAYYPAPRKPSAPCQTRRIVRQGN